MCRSSSRLRAGDDLLDPRGVDAAVGDQLFQRQPGDLAADRVEGADDHHAGRVVDDHVHAGGLLEGADVPPLAADDPPLHLVVGNVHRAGGGFGGVGGGVALERGQQDLAGLLLADLGQPLLVGEDHRPGLLLELAVEDFQQPPGGLLLAQAAQLVQGLPLQVQQLGEFLLAAVGVLDALGQLALGALDHLLLLAEHLGLLFQGVLALVEQPLAFVQLAAEAAQLLFAFGLLLQGQSP